MKYLSSGWLCSNITYLA